MPLLDGTSQRIAIVMPSWIGDTIMATPVLRALRTALPQTKLIGIMRRGLDAILAGDPWLDESIVCDMKGLVGPWRLGSAIRASGADAVLLLPNSFRSALGARLSGCKRRIGYDRDHRGWLLTDRKMVTVPNLVAAVEYYAKLGEWALGQADIDRRIELFVTDEEQREADRVLGAVKGRLIVLNPGANRADKRWPAEKFAKVADRLAARGDYTIVISGSPNEREVLDAVKAATQSPVMDLSRRNMSLGGLKAVIKRASLLITNDTGPRHIAAALGTPVVSMFGPTDHRWTTLQGVREHILLAEPFLPEELVADRFAKICAIDKIAVGDVVAAAEHLLKQ